MLKSIRGLLVCLISCLLVFNHVQAQDSVSVHEKYFRYRDRLNYFVAFSDEPGGGLLANIRNRDVWYDPDGLFPSGDEVDYHMSITYGQTHTRTGYLLGTLATEYALLMQAGDTIAAEKTLMQIRVVLNAFERTDRCESGAPWFTKDTLDGFFVREDALPVLSPVFSSQLNAGLNDSDYFALRASRGEYGFPSLIMNNSVEALKMYESPDGYFFTKRESGHPNEDAFNRRNKQYLHYYKNQKFTSQDEVLGSFVGLALTIKFVDDEAIRKSARDHVLRMINFMCGSRKTLWWRPLFPDGTRMGNENGADGRAYAFALKTLAYKLVGKEYLKKHYPAIVRAPWCRDAYEGTELACLSGIGYSEYRILRFLMAEAMSVSGVSRVGNNVPKIIYLITDDYEWDTFYLLLHASLNNIEVDGTFYDFNRLSTQLQQAPPNGTWQYGNSSYPKTPGWSAEFKWSATTAAQNGKTGESWALGNYSGIDFMLLHNLACLVIPEYNASWKNRFAKN